ncbi:hypothetical protein [Paenibacillus bouchesdurhonensis]|uniref:hypothetical protein n=1 Tax=Paenibacillus bouchesdurhonensis TaxID=1870990 RepID=UPI00190045EE|nr:hypothetical protein [Paenibacillus bouchesdurhonensis]
MKKQIVIATLAGALILGAGGFVLNSYAQQTEFDVEPAVVEQQIVEAEDPV